MALSDQETVTWVGPARRIAIMKRVGWLACSLCRAWPILLSASLCAQEKPIIIAASTVLDGRGKVLHDTRIVVQDGKIVKLDPQAGPVDCDLKELITIKGDPVTDITAVRNVPFVVKGGIVYKNATRRARNVDTPAKTRGQQSPLRVAYCTALISHRGIYSVPAQCYHGRLSVKFRY